MLGQLEVVKAFLAAQPGAQKIPGPHSIPLLSHAKAGGEKAAAVLEYLKSLGDAGGPPSISVAEEKLTALVGAYEFGIGPADRIDITFTKGTVTFTRPGSSGRRLIPLGDSEFYPAGASAVRVRFDGPVLTVHDPGLVLTARRRA